MAPGKTIGLTLLAMVCCGMLVHVHAQCRTDEILAGEDEKYWYCASRDDFPEAAAQIVFALDAAAKAVNPDKSLDPASQDLNCSSFFRAAGKRLGAVGEEWTREDLQANDIARLVAADHQHWEALIGSSEKVARQVQHLANLGVVVVGFKIAPGHGHIAIASPIPPNISVDNFSGHGPMVRDGNVHMSHGSKKPSGWGAVRASYAFANYTSDGEEPIWYVWLPSVNGK